MLRDELGLTHVICWMSFGVWTNQPCGIDAALRREGHPEFR